MQFIKSDINIDFIGKRKIAFFISIAMILISFLSLLIHRGPRYGIDFAGGTLIQVKFQAPVDTDAVKTGLASIALSSSSVQQFGDLRDNEYLIRTDISETAGQGFARALGSALNEATGGDVEIRRVEMVGPQVGKDLRKKALFAMFFALLFITIYISGRFELKWILSGVMAGALGGAVCLVSLFKVSIPVLKMAALIGSRILLLVFWLK